MKPKWQKLASMAQVICTLKFQFFGAVFASEGYPLKNIFTAFFIKIDNADPMLLYLGQTPAKYLHLCCIFSLSVQVMVLVHSLLKPSSFCVTNTFQSISQAIAVWSGKQQTGEWLKMTKMDLPCSRCFCFCQLHAFRVLSLSYKLQQSVVRKIT